MPVAPVVVKRTDGKTVFAQSDGLIFGAVTVLLASTVIVPDALAVPHPPTSGTV
jgi:hypothetical protein